MRAASLLPASPLIRSCRLVLLSHSASPLPLLRCSSFLPARAFASTFSRLQVADPTPSEALHKLHLTGRAAPRAQVSVDGATIAQAGSPTVDLSPDGPAPPGEDGTPGPGGDDELGLETGSDGVVRGKLSSTSSKLLRLTLPLPSPDRPIAFVLHPSQPLSYIARLIASELPDQDIGAVEFLGFGKANKVRWSDATDIGDFVQQAARVNSFTIRLHRVKVPSTGRPGSSPTATPDLDQPPLHTLEVLVPSFEARTFYLRSRLRSINAELRELGDLKIRCDQEAHRGARRLAYGGLGGLIVYWGVVYALTFHVEGMGWDVMEPVTYLVSQAVITTAYLWWLMHQREPSQTAVMNSSVSARQAKLYDSHGFDLQRFQGLTTEGGHLREEIGRISQEYGAKWSERADSRPPREVRESEELEERAEREGKRLDPARSEKKAEKEKEKRKGDQEEKRSKDKLAEDQDD